MTQEEMDAGGTVISAAALRKLAELVDGQDAQQTFDLEIGYRDHKRVALLTFDRYEFGARTYVVRNDGEAELAV